MGKKTITAEEAEKIMKLWNIKNFVPEAGEYELFTADDGSEWFKVKAVVNFNVDRRVEGIDRRHKEDIEDDWRI